MDNKKLQTNKEKVNMNYTIPNASEVEKKIGQLAEIEQRLNQLEKISHKSCGGGQSVKYNFNSLPQLPSRKETPLEQRVTSIENKLEELIKILSQ
jgi:hypothetical protein